MSDQSSATPQIIDVVIVEPHQHVLEHIHHVMRRSYRKRKNQRKWTMIHFDSHPDLACPNDSIPASFCFNPRRRKRIESRRNTVATTTDIDKEEDGMSDEEGKDLYELLDTSICGIAEWIIPLVFSGDLKRLYWIKNEWCHQFENGNYKLNFGAWMMSPSTSSSLSSSLQSSSTSNERDEVNRSVLGDGQSIHSFLDLPQHASVKTSFSHTYYLDDDSVVPDHELYLKQQLHLVVADLQQDATTQLTFSNQPTTFESNINRENFSQEEGKLNENRMISKHVLYSLIINETILFY